MTFLKDLPLATLQLYVTAPYPCSYLPDRQARSQVVTPSHLINTEVYAELIRNGFRRSGIFTYRPHCDGCHACTPVRVLARDFQPNRSQRRAWKKHANLSARVLELDFSEEHYQLYLRYQTVRHESAGMDKDTQDQYTQFLLKSKINTHLVEFRETEHDNALRMVSIIDLLDDGLSSVYTFYDPDIPQTSYGAYNVLWQIAQAQQLGMAYVYLGYWVNESPKMAYKINFQPLEAFIQGKWEKLPNAR